MKPNNAKQFYKYQTKIKLLLGGGDSPETVIILNKEREIEILRQNIRTLQGDLEQARKLSEGCGKSLLDEIANLQRTLAEKRNLNNSLQKEIDRGDKSGRKQKEIIENNGLIIKIETLLTLTSKF